jgi:hypothetical protein
MATWELILFTTSLNALSQLITSGKLNDAQIAAAQQVLSAANEFLSSLQVKATIEPPAETAVGNTGTE